MGLKILVIDDSAVVRQTLSRILLEDSAIDEVVTAQDPYAAVEKLKQFVPDVITLDIEMPRMDGLSFLKKLMSQHPLPVVMCSTLTASNSVSAIKALEYGAVEIIEKPKVATKKFLDESKVVICDVVKAAAQAKVKRVTAATARDIPQKLSADAVLAKAAPNAMIQTTEKVIAVGASTGGTEALRVFIEMLPMDFPGVVIVQHMPENFTRSFAERLDTLCKVSVKEAVNGDTVLPGRVLIAPGNQHMLLKRSGARYYIEVKNGPLVSRHRPSVDVLFRSTARYAGKNGIGVIMTGMGDDGAKGLLEMKEAGAQTIAQDEKSCVVFGMPKVAIDLGAAQQVVPLNRIASSIIRMCG
ncbi:protein-glutamate methylesterase/protein-glutamine glutaminase [Desulfogranum japonicum]|uniref:protein-glutamate methylesterase/protein-glutamine glutaminase n=1 Tax=Desulfogranum japonicum TaxID=231447 RepID=UPI000413F453|nr:chemotaxis response regulator protein-glutamate methylesterase [Desulfogranum japonicum]